MASFSGDVTVPEGRSWEDPSANEATIRWVRELIDDMCACSDSSAYLNFAGFQEAGDDMTHSAFQIRYERLAVNPGPPQIVTSAIGDVRCSRVWREGG